MTAPPRGVGLLDLTLATPEENLAADEALLLDYESAGRAGGAPRGLEVLRFWESPVPFVVLGVAGKLTREVDVAACRRDGVAVLRRASGGGTVVQGPGCLNFALVLGLEPRPSLRRIDQSYATILTRTAAALGRTDARHEGISDITLAGRQPGGGGRKISGNAQKRTRHAVLHHGTILHAFDLSLVERYLREPRKQPEYRRGRRHAEFVANLELTAPEIKSRIAAAWSAESRARTVPPLGALITEKYGNPAWTERF